MKKSILLFSLFCLPMFMSSVDAAEKEMLDNWAETWRKDFIRIERSKRERKE